jgi:hypothetical protein
VLGLSVHARALARTFPYALGVLLAHLLNPRLTAPPPTWEALARAAAACAPVLWVMWQMVAVRGGTDAEVAAFYARTAQWVVALELLVWYAMGLLVGSRVVPQHLG